MRTAIAVLLLATLARADWAEDLDRLLVMPEGEARKTAIAAVADAAPGWTEVAARLRAIRFVETTKGEAFLRKTVCADGVERPWVLVVPPSYDPARPTPLLVMLHGGVSRAEVVENPLEHVAGNGLVALASARGWMSLVPYGQKDATWWDPVGMANIKSLVRRVKQERNVDDDRVFMGGASDGASAGFLHAMVAPDDYAAVLALIGHMGVGSLDGDLDSYAPNFFNTPIYAVTNDADALYPTSRMRATIDMGNRAGGRIFYRERFGGHSTETIQDEIALAGDFLERHPRNPFPTRIVWESSSAKFGRCRWLAIDLVSTDVPASWHGDHNVALTDDRVSIGFFPKEHEGPGCMVGGTVEKSFAANVGLVEGDVIHSMNGLPTPDLEALTKAKSTVKRGDEVNLAVVREGKAITLAGSLPPVAHYNLFKRERPSGIVKAKFASNRFDLLTSRVAALRILVYAEMVRFDMPVVVRVNGANVFRKAVQPDVRVMLRDFLANRDRKRLCVAEIVIEP